MDKGIEKGFEKGSMAMLLSSIQNLSDTLQLSAEQTMIALKIPEAERPKYLEMLKS